MATNEGPKLPAVLSSALPTIEWSLDESHSHSMLLQPLEVLQRIRSSQQQQTTPPLLRIDRSHPLVADLPNTLDELFPYDGETRDERCCFGRLSVALVLLGNELADEAHNIVLPMSFPVDTDYGGPSEYGQVSEVVSAYASYIHGLVHRKEGFSASEYGMTGFANASFWSNAVYKAPATEELPHGDLLAQVRALVNQNSTNEFIQKWAQDYDIMLVQEPPFFESRAVHQLCAYVMRDPDQDPHLKRFAEQVAEVDLQVMLCHSLKRAGYTVSLEALKNWTCDLSCLSHDWAVNTAALCSCHKID